MRQQFPGHYRLSVDTLKQLWGHAIVVVDTSVLLDVFRVSEETANQLLSALEKLRPQLWLPYDVAREYHANLERVIGEQTKPYDDAVKQLNELVSAFTASRKHPFLDPVLLKEVQFLFARVESALDERKKQVLGLLSDNPLKERIADLFANRVGDAFDAETLEAIYMDGKRRFTAEIPPGYVDRKDKPEPRCYGDLVIWKAIVKHIQSEKRPCLMVTGDVKDDWFLRVSGKTIGPRPELIAEVAEAAAQSFHLYSTPQFLQYASEYLGASVGEAAIQEVRDISRARVAQMQSFAHGRMVVRHHIMRVFGANPRESTMKRARELPGYWLVRLADGRRAIIDESHPQRYALFTPWPEAPRLMRVSDELSGAVGANEIEALPWLEGAFLDLEQSYRRDRVRRAATVESGSMTRPDTAAIPTPDTPRPDHPPEEA